MSALPNMSSDHPLAQRLSFLGFDAAARERLERLGPMVLRHIDAALSQFYEKIEATAEVAAFFAGRSQMDAAMAKQSLHWKALARGKLGDDYYASSLRVGNRHAMIGLEPKWYIGGYGLILETLIKNIMHDWIAETMVAKRRAKPAEIVAEGDAMAAGLADLIKVAMVDIDLAVSTYFAALEKRIAAARDEAETRSQVQQEVLGETGRALEALALGELDTRIETKFPGDFERLGDDFNRAAQSVEAAVTEIRKSADTIAISAGSVASSAIDLSDRMTRQAAAIEQSSAALDEVTANVTRTASGTSDAATFARAANDAAQNGGVVLSKTEDAMLRIEQSSREISTIIEVIDDIALQTNLLALNAAVEAARAGEAGRGFAVVATEVRLLAQRSAQAAKDVAQLAARSGSEVDNGVGMVKQTGETLSVIVDQVARISTHMQSFSTASGQQAHSLNEVNAAIVQLDRLTQENAAFVNQAGEAGRDLNQEVADLRQRLSVFRTAS